MSNSPLSEHLTVRLVQQADLPALAAIDMDYNSEACYRVRKQQVGEQLQYSICQEPLAQPFCIAYAAWDWADVPGFMASITAGQVWGAFLAAPEGETCVGLLELSWQEEQQAAQIESLYVHRPLRGQGVGTALFDAGLTWARQQGARALLVTTQAVDVPAITFYLRRGFSICGVHDHFYYNDDLATGEVALFLAYELD